MAINLLDASSELSKLDLKIESDSAVIDVLWFRVMTQKGQWEIKRHRHFSFEFHFIAKGSSRVILDDAEFDIKAGEFYITSPGIYHTQVNKDLDEYVEYSLNCDIQLLNEENSEEKALVEVLRTGKCRPIYNGLPILELFREALYEAYNKSLGFQIKIQNVVKTLIIESGRELLKTNKIDYKVDYNYKKFDFRFIQIHRFITDNINRPIQGKEIAEYIHLSEKQISRIIKANTGVSTKELINEMKLNEAKELLKNTELAINEISDNLGFSSQYYFNQFFRKKEGVAPTVFRKDVRKTLKVVR